MTLSYHARIVEPNGDFMGDGLDHLLEDTGLHPWDLFVRETCQNAWDARRPDLPPVRFDIELRHLTKQQQDTVRDVLLRDRPEHLLKQIDLLAGYLDAPRASILTVTDRNTTGLTGPSRSGVPSENQDFANLVFNMGARRDKRHGGGTHGFGKLIAYERSQCSTIVIHSYSSDERGEPVERLIVSAVTPSYEDGSTQYVGRHWWGAVDDGIVEPVTGDTARDLAAAIGLPPLGDNERGTTVAVLDPFLINDSAQETVDLLGEAITRHLWPKLVPLNKGEAPPMAISLRLDGKEQTIRDPLVTKPFDSMVKALQAARKQQGRSTDQDWPGVEVFSVDRKRRQKAREETHLGFLAVAHGARPGPVPLRADTGSAVPHHVARMREVELVVDYLPCGEAPSGSDGWVGVFICNPDIDDDFARSEPATHDRWSHKWPKQRNEDPDDHAAAMSNVKLAEQRTREIIDSLFDPPAAPSVLAPATGSGVVSQRLAGLVSAPRGGGAGPAPSRTGTGGTGPGKPPREKWPNVALVESTASETNGEMIRFLKWKIENPPGRDVVFRLGLKVMTADGRPETKHEVGPLPAVQAFRLDSVDSDWNQFVVGPDTTVYAEAEIHQPADTAIDVGMERVS